MGRGTRGTAAVAVAAIAALLAGCAVTVTGTAQARSEYLIGRTSGATSAHQTGSAPSSHVAESSPTTQPAPETPASTTAPSTTGPSTAGPLTPALSTTGPVTPESGTTSTGTGVFPTLGTSSSVPDDKVGLKKDAPQTHLAISGYTGDRADQVAADTLADLFAYYGSIFDKDFGQKFVRPAHLVSYDSTDRGSAVCGTSTYHMVNAFYSDACDTVAWDRGVMLPEMISAIGILAPAVVLSHEIGHDVQHQLGVPDSTSTLVLEQQADCYAGAYWRWVADGHSRYFNFNQTEGMRQMLLALFQGHDPVGSSGQGDDDHGNGFDRTYAATLGYTSGAVRCSTIDQAEIDARGQEFPFDGVPQHYGNVDITADMLRGILGTVDEYFTQTAPGYLAPTLDTFTGRRPPACAGYESSYPVTYCPTTNTVSYNLEELQRIGTPTAGWESANGDFSAIVLLVSRYALAAQAAGHSPITGDNAGLRALCYAGTWATWMRNPQGPQQFQLSPNDLDKAIYEIVSSPLPGADANGDTTATLIERVQAFDIGVTHPITECFDFYSG